MSKHIVAALALTFFSCNPTFAQKSVLDLDTELVALSTCQGAVMATVIHNYVNEVLSEERARTVARTVEQGVAFAILQREGYGYLASNGARYRPFVKESLQRVIYLLDGEDFGWDDQNYVDGCMARLLHPVITVTADDLERAGLTDYFGVRLGIHAAADKTFDFTLKLLKALQ